MAKILKENFDKKKPLILESGSTSICEAAKTATLIFCQNLIFLDGQQFSLA
jgi:hypothetical protein